MSVEVMRRLIETLVLMRTAVCIKSVNIISVFQLRVNFVVGQYAILY